MSTRFNGRLFGTINGCLYNGGVLNLEGRNRDVPLYIYILNPAQGVVTDVVCTVPTPVTMIKV